MATKARRDDDLDEELAREASKDTARSKARGGGSLGGPSDKISVRDKRFSLGDTLLDKATKGRSFKGVLLNFAFVNEYYEGKFDKNKPASPVCWALSEDGEDMTPHKNSAEKQNDACTDCPMNEWGSGTEEGSGSRGRKACKQGVRVALVHSDDIESAEAAEDAVIGFIPLPPTSVKPFNEYIDKLQELGRPMYSVVTEFTFDEEFNYAVVNYSLDEKITDRELISALKDRRDEALEKLMTPYNKLDGKSGDEKPKRKARVEDEEDEDEPPRKKRRVVDEDDSETPTPKKKKRVVEEDEDDEKPRKKKRVADDDDSDEEDEEEDPPARKKRTVDDEEDVPARKKRKSVDTDEDDDDGDDEKPVRKKKRVVEEDDEEEDDKPVKKRGSRFGGK